MKREYGVFTYCKDGDVFVNSECYGNKTDAVKQGKKLAEEFKNTDYYVEVWRKDRKGVFGNSGTASFSSFQ